MKRIVALDPGGTTGWAMWQDQAGGKTATMWDHFFCGQIGPEEHHEELYELLERFQTHDFTVISETFDFRQHDNFRTGVNLISREYIGVAKLFALQRMHNSPPVVLQTPASAKTFVTDEKLKVMGLWVPGKQHARDALRHLIYYLVNKEKMYNLIKPWRNL